MIIESLLDTDLYKFTMQQVVWHRFPQAHVEYAFRCRNADIDLRPYADEIRAEIDRFCCLTLTPDELAYLNSIRYLKNGYVDSLRQYRLDPAAVRIGTNRAFTLRIEGNWYQTILFEVPVLAIINEVYFRNTQPNAYARSHIGYERLKTKCRQVREADVPLHIMEFGTRRRYSREWQKIAVGALAEKIPGSLVGTSNVALAKAYGLKPYGTMAHEFLQACQAFTALPDFQRFALEAWMQEYRGDLGIALSDVVGIDAFLRDFDRLFCKAYDGARHDSGDPYEWGEKLIAHYEKMGIDATTKSAVFSDALDIPKSLALARHFNGRIRTTFGIGTNLTNDFEFEPLQIVLKMVRCNGRPVAKVSDSPGKGMCDDAVYLAYLRAAFHLDQQRETVS